MLKKVVSLIVFTSLAMCVAVSAQTPSKVMADKIVAVVGNSAILYSQVEEYATYITEQRHQAKFTSDRSAMSEALENLMLQKLLYYQSQVDSLQINNDMIQGMVDRNIDAAIKEKGSIKGVEEFYHKPIYDIRGDFYKRYSEMSFAQQMQQEVQSKVKITPGEVTKFYLAINKDSLNFVPEQFEYAQIVKYPASTVDAIQRTRERLLEIRERVMKGEKFETLARIYSLDPGSAIRGGEMDPMPKDGLTKPFADAMVKLRPGQVSEIVETEFGYHIIQMIDKKGNLFHVRHILLRPEFSPLELSETSLRLDSIVGQIRLDSITFGKAALIYSDDKSSRLNGGLVSNIDILEQSGNNDVTLMSTKIYKENLPRADYVVLNKLAVGEISDAFQAANIKGNTVVKVLKLVSVMPSHIPTLQQDYLEIENAARVEKQQTYFLAWLKEKIETTYVRIDPEFRNAEDFVNKAWLK